MMINLLPDGYEARPGVVEQGMKKNFYCCHLSTIDPIFRGREKVVSKSFYSTAAAMLHWQALFLSEHLVAQNACKILSDLI